VVMRWVAVLPELVLAVALALAFGAALLARGPAGLVSRAAWVGGAAGAFAAAVLTHGAADDFLFAAYRVDPYTQFVKAVVSAGSLIAAVAARGEGGAFVGARVTGPFLRLAALTTLVAAASAADLLVLWILLELVAVAHVAALATEGRWSANAALVWRAVGGWLPTALVLGLGVVLTGAEAETLRLPDLEGIAPNPGVALVLLAILVRAGTAPLTAVRALLRGEENAPLTALSGAWWILLVAVAVRVAMLNAPGPQAWATAALVALGTVPGMLLIAASAGRGGPAAGRRPSWIGVASGAALTLATVPWALAAARALP